MQANDAATMVARSVQRRVMGAPTASIEDAVARARRGGTAIRTWITELTELASRRPDSAARAATPA